MLKQIDEQKSDLIQRFDLCLMPMAQEAINQLLQDAKQLNVNLEETLDRSHSMTCKNWTEQAAVLAQLHAKWHSQTALTDKVLELVSHRAKAWIDKDCQVIEDYKNQSLAHLSSSQEELKNLEERLKQATAEPLKQLLSLHQQSPKHQSLKQASDWLAHFQFQRENCFDHLLMKIDALVQEIVQTEELNDAASNAEIEGEILFVQKEFQHLHQKVKQLSNNQAEEKEFLKKELKEFLDHIEQFRFSLPKSLQRPLLNLKQLIEADLKNLS